jgi:5'-3' exonuclease
LLGNDFLPHSLTVKMRDDGHASLTRLLKENPDFVTEQDNLFQINHDVLYSIIKTWALEEDKRIMNTFKRKFQMRGHSQKTLETRPLEWMVEQPLLSRTDGQWILNPAWAQTYRTEWLQCPQPRDLNSVCREYIYGLQWVLDYYTGQRPVNMQWCFSRLLPPLWGDLVSYLEKDLYEELTLPSSNPIQPSEQLAMVLPLESWHFIEDASLRYLPLVYPQFWPSTFQFFSAGRIHMWECEPLLPILSVERIRSAVKQRLDSVASK